jgi:hypothetical protein
MRTSLRLKRPLALVLSFGFVTLAAGQANAGCLNGLRDLATPGKSSTPAPATPSAQFIPAVYRPGDTSGPKFMRVGDWNGDDEPIVGLWQFELNGGMDFGTQAWHSDGTELMFSAGRDPATGDICQGVWRKIGPRAYTLNHIAMGYDQGFGGPLVRVHIHAIVKVDRSGKTYSGTFNAVVCINTATDPFHEGDDCIKPPPGTMSGTWVKPD